MRGSEIDFCKQLLSFYVKQVCKTRLTWLHLLVFYLVYLPAFIFILFVHKFYLAISITVLVLCNFFMKRFVR